MDLPQIFLIYEILIMWKLPFANQSTFISSTFLFVDVNDHGSPPNNKIC